jgi:leucyl-tRNA synthetase
LNGDSANNWARLFLSSGRCCPEGLDLWRPGTGRQELERLALAEAKAQPFLAGKQVVKIVVVPDKLVNIVVK